MNWQSKTIENRGFWTRRVTAASLSVCLSTSLSACLNYCLFFLTSARLVLSVCVSICLSACLSVCLSARRQACLSVSLFVCLSVSICLLVCQSFWLSARQSVSFSVLFVCMSARLSVFLFNLPVYISLRWCNIAPCYSLFLTEILNDASQRKRSVWDAN